MKTTDPLVALQEALKALRLPALRSSLDEVAQRARQEGLSHEAFLLELLERECDARRQHRIARALRAAKLPLEKTLDTFDRQRLPRPVDAQLAALLDGRFLDRRENVLAFGQPGSGKTHLLCALGYELIYADRQVLFRPCDLLVQDLLRAKRELTLARLLKQWSRFDALIIDDIGYVQHSREEMEVLFNLLAHRYERGSVLLTANLPFSRWEEIFKDPMTTAAAIDRLVHHSVVLELNIPSYRLEHSSQRLAQTTAPPTSTDAAPPTAVATPNAPAVIRTAPARARPTRAATPARSPQRKGVGHVAPG
jgi:DNA replication protein DnaC